MGTKIEPLEGSVAAETTLIFASNAHFAAFFRNVQDLRTFAQLQIQDLFSSLFYKQRETILQILQCVANVLS